MKKRLFPVLVACLMMPFLIISCDNDEVKDANVQFTLDQTTVSKATFGEPVVISGKIASDAALTSLTFTGVKLENGSYTPQGDAQEYKTKGAASFDFTMEFIVDTKTMTHIEIKASVGKASKTTYIPVGAIEGDAKGSALLTEVLMKADSIVWNAENSPAIYTTPNTGAAATTPSFFSIHGVSINGEVKHVLTGDEIRSVEGRNGSFCFLNVLQNTANKAYIGGQRGYMFSNLWKTQMTGGTTGRQCDMYEIGGKAIRQENIDTTTFKIIAGSWIGTNWNEARYKFVDSLFVVLGNEATTQAAKLKAFYQLGLIQKKLDNATLGETNNPTSLGSVNYARRRTDAGTGATNAMAENYRAGDYILLKNQKGGKLYYGIMQIVQMYDDNQCMVEVNGVKRLGQNESKALFHKPLILNIKVQTMN